MSDGSSIGEWVIVLGEDESAERRFRSVEELIGFLDRLAAEPEGHITAFVVYGMRPWWQRLLGLSERFFDLKFSLEWSAEFASLVFHDEAASEYRVLDQTLKVEPEVSVRHRLAHGDLTPAAADECMTAARAWTAVNVFVRTGARPSWLEYRYVR